ncbi:MAG: hypothetical protein IK023_05150 [Bacteroidaceae bacterium]|nr:hypothetical protein [Bacteroidaceae bacterium]
MKKLRKKLTQAMVFAFVMIAFSACKSNNAQQAAEQTGDNDTVVATATHAEYDGISLDMPIESFIKTLEDRGYALGEKDPTHRMYKYYDQFEALWVYYDSQTNKVWMVINLDLHYEDMELGDQGEKRLWEIIVPEYEEKYNTKIKGFCEGVDCIDIPGGCIIFGYDELLGAMIMTVDEQNSNNYENLYDTTYGISPYGIEK